MSIRKLSGIAGALALLLVLGACGSDDNPAQQAQEDTAEQPAEEELVYVATEFAFEGPDTLPAGDLSLTFDNQGEQEHELIIVELLKGKTVEDVEKLLASGPVGKPPKWVREVDDHAFAKPGKTDVFEAEFTPGDYVALCFVGDKKTHKPHAVLGMIKAFTVE